MKINKRILKQMILEILNESNELSSSLSGGPGVTPAAAKVRSKERGEDAVKKADVQSADENKIIQRFSDLFTSAAQKLDATDSENYPFLNTVYKRVLKHFQDQLKNHSPPQGDT